MGGFSEELNIIAYGKVSYGQHNKVGVQTIHNCWTLSFILSFNLSLRLCFTNPNLTPEMIQATAELNAENEAEARNYEEELGMTLDASGNPVMIDGKEPKASSADDANPTADVIADVIAAAADDANPTTDEAVSYYKSRASH